MSKKISMHYKDISPMKIILSGYCFIILAGTILLTMPFAAKSGESTDFLVAFFTATSATCVTGLILVDTYTHWTFGGQLVILCLIQIGGIGFITICISALALTKKKIGFATRNLMQNSISAPQIGGIVRITHLILWGTILVETIGIGLLFLFYYPMYGFKEGLWYSVFHSISAFCNAGFDLMGRQVEFSSFTGQVGNLYVNTVIMFLIIIGGLGFIVWHDLIIVRFKFSRIHLHTKLVLYVSSILIVGGAVIIFIMEKNSIGFQNISLAEQGLASLFQSVSARTAGFNTIDFTQISESGLLAIICLMLIGGSTGSTAGGIKTTTFAVLILSIVTTFWHKKSVEVFGRRLEDGISHIASCIFMMYLIIVCFSAMIISSIEDIPLIDTMFECVSAIATVGLTTGITVGLSNTSLLILIFLMIFGRAGSLTMLLAFSSRRMKAVSTLPLEKIQIG